MLIVRVPPRKCSNACSCASLSLARAVVRRGGTRGHLQRIRSAWGETLFRRHALVWGPARLVRPGEAAGVCILRVPSCASPALVSAEYGLGHAARVGRASVDWVISRARD